MSGGRTIAPFAASSSTTLRCKPSSSNRVNCAARPAIIAAKPALCSLTATSARSSMADPLPVGKRACKPGSPTGVAWPTSLHCPPRQRRPPRRAIAIEASCAPRWQPRPASTMASACAAPCNDAGSKPSCKHHAHFPELASHCPCQALDLSGHECRNSFRHSRLRSFPNRLGLPLPEPRRPMSRIPSFEMY